MGRGRQRVCRDVVVWLTEEIGGVEHETQINQEENAETEEILGRVIGMEGDGVLRPSGVDTQRIVGLHRVQGYQMEKHHGEDKEGEQVMEGVETGQCRVANGIAAPQPVHDLLAHQRDR